MKILSSFSFIVGLSVLFGFITGKIPYGNDIAKISLMAAMTIAISNIPFKLSDFNRKKVFMAVAINYIFLSLLIFILSIPFLHTPLFAGFVVMAAAPPAVAVLPLTKVAGGNGRLSLFGLIICYLLSLAIIPILVYALFSKVVNLIELAENILLLIVIPMILSRFVKIEHNANEMINLLFFFVIFPIVGANRSVFFQHFNFIAWLSILMMIRTVATGWIVKFLGERKYGREDAISYSLFASFKNEGLVMILAASIFNETAAIPALIATIFELIWVAFLELKIA